VARAQLHEGFEAHARATPRAEAVIALAGERGLDYGELDARAERLAARLRVAGARGLVGVALPPTVDFVVAVLAIAKAGSAFVPLDPAYPTARLQLMLDDTRVSLVVSRAELAQQLPVGAWRLVDVEDDGAAVSAPPRALPGGDDLAYVMYTSGSTGRPKGIAIPHAGIVNNLYDLVARNQIGPGDRALFLSSPSFDLSVLETLGTLTAGASLVLVDPERRDPEALADRVAEARATVWSSTPALLSTVVEHLKVNDRRLATLRLVLTGGDWIPTTLPARLHALAPSARFVVLGGGTEASICSTDFAVTRVDPAWRSLPYGRPLANQRVYVLDAWMQPVPIGVAGELYLGGAGLARGYLGQPGRTAERFVPSPFGDGERLYRTGDRVRWRAEGWLELLGRIDEQVKIRGVRVEPGEIEARLVEHEAVRQAVVIAVDGRLVAYVVARGAPPSPSSLRRHLRARLPAPLVPDGFLVLPSLPLTPNGKIDRRALPPLPARATGAPLTAPPSFGAAKAKPQTPTEEIIARIARETLRLPAIEVDEDLFELGCDSLQALRLLGRVRVELGVELPLRELHERPTIAQLAARAVERLAELAASELAALVDEARRLSPDRDE
jgi:amino acid adenylation domain-containing protein